MTGNEYQKLAARTINRSLTKRLIAQHALYGICSETGELLGLYQKELQGHEITEEHFLKEIGDILWMVAELLTITGYQMDDVMALNIEKLKARYPDGFEAEKSIHRKKGDI